jgi:NADH:ubiquinone oxidoreductase subunit 6 (subunit J)
MEIGIERVAFLAVAGIALAGAVGVVAARSVFTSALGLVLAFLGVSGLYVLLDAGFLAVVQILIYVGAISVLILFAVMLTPHLMAGESLFNQQWSLALIVALIAFGFLGMLAHGTDWPTAAEEAIPPGGAVVVTGAGGLSTADALAVPGAVEEKDASGASVVRIPGTVERLGRSLMADYLLPFEVVSALLLVALVGAIAIARE